MTDDRATPRKVRLAAESGGSALWCTCGRKADFDLGAIPVSPRSAKGNPVSKWPMKDVKPVA